MKKQTISVLMMILILTSMLNMASIIRPSLAENDENCILDKDFMEKNSDTTLPNQANKLDAKQEKTLENPSQTSRYVEDEWNFNDTSEWSNFTYRDGNKTRLIVGVNGENPESFLELEKIAAKHEAKIVNTVSMGGEVKAVVVELLLASTTAFVEEVRVVGLASYVEPNMKVQAQFVPNDPYWSMQWGPQKIEADWAWNATVGDPSVLVAVVDTGIYYTHSDLAANYAPLGYDWVNLDPDPMDDNGHGTHCAGIIAAVLNNSVGIAGLAQVRVMAEKVLDSGGGGYWDWIANGIINATDCGADIISMSLGGYGDSELVHEAVKYAYDAGVLVIAAAGNDNTNTKLYPAGYDEVVAVAATDQYDNKASWSNWGDWIELAAPGVDIYSTVPWGYESWSGTSMATPHVSGVAALVWSQHPSKTRDWVRLWLRYSADDLGDPGFDVYYGYGRVNARKAVEQSPPVHELIAYEWGTPPYVEPEALGTINATILNFGENDETDVIVQLLANDTIVDSTLISFLASGNSTTVSLVWNPTVEGLYNVTLYVAPVLGETIVENNVLWKYIYVGFPVKSVVLHSAGNILGDIITNWQVLNSEWHLFGNTMIYVDYTTLNKEDITYADIAATGADVLIISCAYDPWMGWEYTDSEIEAIEQYVHEGHGLIVTAGTLYYGVPNNNKLAPLFGLNETTMWDTTGTDLLHLLNVTHPLFRNVPNPFVFADVGTSIPFDGRWDSNELVGGKYVALGHYQESAIVTYRSLVYISPWLEVIPPYYHHHLQLLYNAIAWSRYQKPQHELILSLEAPRHLEPGESVLLNVTVTNLGLNNETNVELFLLINATIFNHTMIPELLVGASYTIDYFWAPAEGLYNVTAYTPSLPGEEFTFNNIESVMTSVCYRISIFVTEDNWPIPPDDDLDYYMFNFDPKHPIEWAHWYDLSPVILKATLQIYAYDVDSPNEVDEVYFNGLYIGRLQGANGRWMLNEFTVPASCIQTSVNIVEVYVDRTHVGWFGMTVDWANLTVEYLPAEHELSATLDAPKFLKPGDSSLLNATVTNRGLNNETAVELFLLINGTAVNSTTIPELLTGASYTINYLWTPTVEATYNVTAYAPPVPDEGYSGNNVATKIVSVGLIKHLLFDQTHGTDSITSYSTWVTSLTERDYVVEINTIDPITPTVLEGYDVFVIPQAHYSYTADELLVIHNFVFNGGGLLVIGDDSPWIYTDLTSFAGVTWTSGGVSGITTDITPHPVTTGVASVYLAAPIAIMYVTGSAQDLVRDPADNIMLAVSEQPSGRVIGFADEDSLWNYGTGQADNLRLANNMIDWLCALTLQRDVAVISVAASAAQVYEGQIVNVTVVAKNEGNTVETFDVAAYYGFSLIGIQTVANLAAGANATLVFSWNTTGVRPCIHYPIKAVASLVTGEFDTADNTYVDGTVKVKMVGDVNGDGTVDIFDIISVAIFFGSGLGDLDWNSDVDFYHDGIIDVFDLVIVSRNFGRCLPPPTMVRTTVYVDPQLTTVGVGETFTVNINIFNVTDLYGYEFKLFYDTTVLDGLAVTLPPGHFLTPTDPTKIFIVKQEIKDNFNGTHGYVWFAVSLISPEAPKNGSGVLVTITFKATSSGTSILDLGVPNPPVPPPPAYTKLSDPSSATIPHDSIDGNVTVTA